MKKLAIFSIIFSIIVSSLFAQGFRGEGEGEYFQKLEKTYKSKEYESVLQMGQDYFKQYPFGPNKIKVKLYMGLSQIQMKDYEDAINTFEELDRSYPYYEKNDQVKYLLGKLYYKEENLKDAKIILESLIDMYPKSQYVDKAKEVLKEMGDEKGETTEGGKVKYTAVTKSEYSWSRITWTKIAAGSFLVASPIFYLMGKGFQDDADSIYNNQYKSATTANDAVMYYDQVDDNSGKAALYKNFSWISLVLAGGFFAVDYLWTGRIVVSSTDTKISFHYQF